MPQVVLLNNIDHQDLRLTRRHGAANGETVNQVRVFPSEFRALQRDYALFFRREADGYQTIALLGLDRDENLYLDNERWTTRHIPAILDRGPFSIGVDKSGDQKIMVDLDHPWIDSAGAPLFLRHGGNAPALERAAETLRTLHQGVAIERAMFQAFESAGLLAALDLDIRLDESTEYRLPGLYTLRPDALRDLDADAARRLNRDGWLELAHYVLASHDNLDHLIALKNKRRGLS